jgi:ribosomal protein S6
MTIVNKLKVSDNVEILPTEIGGVQILYKPNTSERLSCNIGDKELSYYIKKGNKQPYFSPFLECNEQIFNEVANNINNFRNA